MRDFPGEAPFDAVLPGRKRGANPEWKLHAACAKLCYQREREDPTFRFFSPGGEGARSPARAEIARRMGQNRKGVPDMWMMRWADGPFFQMCIVEFKRPGGTLTPEQKSWFSWLPSHDDHGRVRCHLCTSVEQFRSILAAF